MQGTAVKTAEQRPWGRNRPRMEPCSTAGGRGASVPNSHNPIQRRSAPSPPRQSPHQAHHVLSHRSSSLEANLAKQWPTVTPGRSCGEGLCRELRQEAAGNQGIPPPPVPLPGPLAHASCRHTWDSSVPRQLGFPEEPAFKQGHLTKMGPRRNTPDQNKHLARGRRHPLC